MTAAKKNTTKADEAKKEKRRRAQVHASVQRHREGKKRVELLLPDGWRERLHEAVRAKGHPSLQAWFMTTAAELLGEDPE